MDKRIGIGIIVGLTIWSSLYIWNTDKYSKLQKAILLPCMAFAPLQWALMGLILIYNNFTNKQTTVEFKNNSNKSIIIYIILVVIIISLIVNNFIDQSDRTNLFKSPEINHNNTSAPPQQYSTPQIKEYGYVVIEVETPELEIIKGYYKSEKDNMFDSNYVEDSYYTKWRKTTYTSDITEIEDYNEDNKNRVLDNFEKEIKLKLSDAEYNYKMKLLIDCKDSSRKEELKEAKSKINFSQIFTFGTYSDASVSKRNYEQYNQTDKNY